MLFVKQTNGAVHSLAFATSHQFSISANTADISTKDHGFWSAKEVTGITWNITTDNLYTVDTFNELYDRMISRQPVEVYFSLKTPTERQGTPATVNLPGDTYTTWTPTTTTGEDGYYGKVYITSLSATAASGDNATFSATFDGIGQLAKGLYGSVESSIGGSTSIIINEGGTNVEYDRASGTYDSSKTYYIYSNGQMLEVEIADATDFNNTKNKQVLYVVKAS
ncbi:MAG: hypothetical protein J6W16_06165 [Methanobrevibacter sp.]|nr:hypothetical protein [Methanobrevibacter sp.]